MNGDKFKGESTFKTWIYKITKNATLSLLMTNKRRNYRYILDGDLEVDFENILISRYNDSLSEDIYGTIKQLLRKMSKNLRTVFDYRYIKGYTVKKISILIKTTINATKMRISRSKKAFINILKDSINV